MKNFLLGMILMTAATSTMASQCGYFFGTDVAESAIESFMSEKLDIERQDITHYEVLDSKSFISRKQMAFLVATAPITATYIAIDKNLTFKNSLSELTECSTNVKYKYNVEFHKGNQLCNVDLQVKLKAAWTLDGLTSVVKQKYKPVCN